MPKVLVTYYSRSGHTEEMAKLVAEGVTSAGCEVDIRPVEKVAADELVHFAGIVMGSPTYYGQMAWQVKKLLDESVKLHGRLDGKVGGAFTSSANVAGGNETTIRGIIDAMLIHGMVVQGIPMGDHYGPVSISAPDDRAREQCRRLGRRTGELCTKLFP